MVSNFSEAERNRPVAVKIIGIGFAAVAGIAFLPSLATTLMFHICNWMDALARNTEMDPTMKSVLYHVQDFALLELIVSTFYIVISLFLLKYKLWAHRSFTIFSVLFGIGCWGIMYKIYMLIGHNTFFVFRIWTIGAFAFSIIASVVLTLSVIALNREKVRTHFS